MNGYDKMHQSLLDGNKVGLFIEAFSLHLYRAFYMNGWLPYKLHSLKPYDDIKMKDTCQMENRGKNDSWIWNWFKYCLYTFKYGGVI